MYSLEVRFSIAWGIVIRFRESQSRVFFPSEVDDEFFSDNGYNLPSSFTVPQQRITDSNCWIPGWNFTAELYRIIEHAMSDFHRRRSSANSPALQSDLFGREIPPPRAVLDKTMTMYEALPVQFRELKSLPQNNKRHPENKFAFQADNIIATLHLVRMILVSSEDRIVD
jgi:hypothetical protein